MRKNLTRSVLRAVLLVLLMVFGVGEIWGSSSNYARGYATVSSSSPSGSGKVYVNYTSSGGSQPAAPASGSSDWKTPTANKTSSDAANTTFDFYYYSLAASGYALEGWSETNGASDYSNAEVAKYSIKTSKSSLNDAYTDVTLYAHFVPNPTVTVTFLAPDSKCTYTVKCDGANVAIGSSKTTNKSFELAVTVNDAGYKLFGWYTTTDGGVTKSYFSPNTTYKNKYFSQSCSVGVELIEASKPVFMVGDKFFTDLNAANSAASAGSNKTIVLVSDGILDAGNYTISSGNTLLIPHTIGSTFVNSQSVIDAPYVVKTAAALSAFKKLTLQDGANITVNGTLCVAGKMMSAGGGKASAYPTGELGVIDMSQGGHIELNSGAKLYAWGFIKGQDMDQGNNTSGCGSITVNSGAVVWEGFATGDWRGGTNSSTIYSNKSSWKFFPFQSYTIQNIEIPVTYNYGSTLSNYMSIFGDGQVYNGTFDLVGSSNTLFLLKDANSKLKKWYDPKTDLVCYEMSGTTQLDALNVDAAGETVSSKDYNLPISTSMHIILASNTTISKPVEIQAGAVIEIKNGVTVTCSSNVYLFDKDQWGEYCYTKYYYTMSNLTSHKDRGNGTSNALIEDAKFIVDGTLKITGKLYTTTGGADIMGNGGGKVTFPSSLATSTNIVMCTGGADNENVAINQACLHNEDDSYTKAIASTTFVNVNGRWFTNAKSTEKANHTYDFTYISSGAVSGTGGTNTTTSAVYSNDKTGLEARMKWANVAADACANWWQGKGEQATWFYNWTLESAWHQFIPTEMENVYSCSNNKLYEKSSCTWGEIGDVDENCLYTIGGIKKALVNGHFLALEANNNDPAYHAADDATQYYLCFAGCNWHEATKYEGESKAYIVDGGNYIWYDGSWLNVQRQEPFFYTLDESNAQVCYEYVNGDWQIATPYIQVTCPTEPTRYLYFFNEALTVASAKKNATITILRDIPDVKVAGSFTGVNTKCTLDLNGYTVTSSVSSMLTINGAGCTFIIKDGTEQKLGKINLYYSANTRRYAVNVTKGHLILQSGTISATNTMLYANGTSATSCAIIVKASQQCTIEGGKVYAQADYNPFGIYGSENNSTITIKGGEVIASVGVKTEPRGIQVTGGTLNVQGGTIEATTYSSGTTGEGILVNQTTSYHAKLNMTGGTVKSTTKSSSIGVYVNCSYTCDSNEPRSITAWSRAEAYISGGEIRVENKNGGTAEGVRSLGTTEISGGKIIVRPTSTTAIGVRLYDGTTTIKGSADIDVAATSTAYGVRISKEQPANKSGVVYNGTLNMTGGTLTVRATGTTDAYGVYVGAHTRAMTTTHASNSSYYAGNYANAGTANISGGVIDVQAKTNKAYSVYVENPVSESGAEGYATATATPKCSITGGKFKVASMTASATDIAATNVSTSTYTISGGYYNNQEHVENYTTAPKHVVTLPATDANYPEYLYKVANSYLVTFMNGSESLQSTYQEEGKVPTYTEAEPTKASAGGFSYAFSGWSTSNNNTPAALTAVTSAGATYYACFEQTDLRYTISLDATTNGGECATEYIRVVPGAAAGSLPSATKEGHTFKGWFTAASGGTQLTASTVVSGDITYYAQFTKNNYTLTWVLDGGKVSTAGKYGSTSWPAKNATGTQSKAIPYGSALTAPVVARTGYTFQTWSPLAAAAMPAEATTYTAIWIPNVNTAYTVKHYLQNVDGSYPTDPYETQSFTGTTATSVTPATKSYDGFIAPATQTVTIGADGKTVVTYQYARMHYTFILDGNGGTTEVPSIEVIHGATIGTVPPDAQMGCNDFVGWFTKPVGGVKITSGFVIEYDMKRLYAQFSEDVRTYSITYLAGANGTGDIAADTKTCGVDATLSSSTFTRAGYTQTGWSTTDGGAKAYDLGGTYTGNAALTLYPFWTPNTNTPYVVKHYQQNIADDNYTEVTADRQNLTGTTDAEITPSVNSYIGFTAPSTQTVTILADGSRVVEYYYTRNSYQLTWNANGGELSGTYTSGSVKYGASITVPTVTRTNYDFDGWDATPVATMPAEALTYTAQWTLAGVIITWKSEDGTSTLETDPLVLIGETPSYDGETPAKATTEGYTYTFDGWTTEANGGGIFYATGSIPAVSAATTYYAHFAATANVASVTVSGATTYYTTIQAAFDYVNTVSANMEIKLLQDATAAASLTYKPKSTYTCTLDLNNHTISGAIDKLINVNLKNAKLIITDNSGPKGGKISTKTTLNNVLSCVYITAGKVDLNSGTIECINTRKYSTSSSYKSTAAAGVYVASSSARYFTMNGGTIRVNATYRAHGVYSFGTTAIKGGEINVSDEVVGVTGSTGTIYGVYATNAKTTISDNAIINVHATVKNAYGACAAGNTPSATGTTYNGTIEITGGTFNVSAPATAVGVYAIAAFKQSSSDASVYYHSHGTANVKGGTFNVSTTSTTSAIGVYVNRGLVYSYTMPNTVTQEWPAQANITGGTFNITTTPSGTTTAEGVRSMGTTVISGGTFDVSAQTESAYGVRVYAGTTTVNNATSTPMFTISAPLYAFGVTAGETPADKTGAPYNGEVTIDGGSFDINATGTGTAYGVYAKASRRKITSTSSGYYIGAYASAGTATVNGGTFNVTATTNAIGVVVAAKSGYAKFTQSEVEYPAAYATAGAEVNGGNFEMTTTSDANATAFAMNASATATDFLVQGGKYSTNKTSASTVIGDKYTRPTKTGTNYWTLPLTGEDPYKYEVAEAYTITFKDGDNNTIQEGLVKKGATPVYSGSTPTKTEDEDYTYTFNGDWSPAISVVTADATYTAQFDQEERPHTYYYIDPASGELIPTTSASQPDVPDYETEDYLYTFDRWIDKEDGSYMASYTSSERFYGAKLDVVDWTEDYIVINANGLKAVNGGTAWTIKKGSDSYTKSDRRADRTLRLARHHEHDVDDYVVIKLQGTAGVESRQKYTVPHIYDTDETLSETKANSIVYVHTGTTLTVDASTTISKLYVSPGANVNITSGTLTVTDTLALRTLPWQTAAISGSFSASHTYYTRIAPNDSTISGLNGPMKYRSASYYQFALPFDCDIADVRLSDGTVPAYENTWALKYYSESSRATNGSAANNWVFVTNTGEDTKVKACTGYEFFSIMPYYREYYFPVTPPSTETSVEVKRTGEDAANSGWNMICSPLMTRHMNTPKPEDAVVCLLNENDEYEQMIPAFTHPAMPFFYQAAAEELFYFDGSSEPSLAPRRVAASEEQTRIQWIHLDMTDANGFGDQTSIYSHPTRYKERYQTGIDVAKQSLTASHAVLYSSHAYGEMAFAGVSDALLENGVALTVYSPKPQELTISMRDNEWLNRMAFVWLIDIETGAQIDLLDSDYTFEANEGTMTGRFILQGRFQAPNIATDLEPVSDSSIKGRDVRKVMINQKIYILVGEQMYDATGKQVNRK